MKIAILGADIATCVCHFISLVTKISPVMEAHLDETGFGHLIGEDPDQE